MKKKKHTHLAQEKTIESRKRQKRDAYKYVLRALWTTLPNFELSNASHASWSRMNLTGGPHSPATTCRRKLKRPSISTLSSRRRPETPLSKWKFFDDDDGKLAGGGQFRRARVAVSARKLAAGLWQLRFTEASAGGGGIGGFKCGPCDRVGSQVTLRNSESFRLSLVMCLVAEKMREKKKEKEKELELEFHLKNLVLVERLITTIGIIELNYI